MAQEVIRPTPILSPQASERFLTIIKNKKKTRKKQGRISTPKLDKVIEFVVQKARAKGAFMKKRNNVMIEINPDFIESWLKSTPLGFVVHSVKGVPQDAEMEDFHYDSQTGMFYALFYHESFPEVPLGARPLLLDCVLTHCLCKGGSPS